jgi:uncharacterized protein (TIGR02217 family)
MAYRSDLMLPKGVDLEWVSGSGYFTRVLRTDSGRESRNQEWDQTLAKYVMRYNVRKQRVWEQIADMFDAAAGMAHSWPLRDPKQNVATAAQGRFEIIDGTTAYMVVTRNSGSHYFSRRVKPADSPNISGGSGTSYDFATGLLTYSSIPDSWDGPYFVCVRFDTDVLELTGVNRKKDGTLLAGFKDVPLQETRDE